MSWLRLPGLIAGDPEHVYDGDTLAEVRVPCRPEVETYDHCCLAPDRVRNGKVQRLVRDRRIDPAPTWLVITVQKMRCRGCKRTLRQHVPHVDADHDITSRLKYDLTMSAINRTFRDARRFHAVEETLIRRVFRSYADAHLVNYRYEAPRVLGIDENVLLGEARGVIFDVEGGKLLDMRRMRTQSALRYGFQFMDNWENVEVWCQDMAPAYKGLAKDLFPKAVIVADKWHVTSKAEYWWDKVRIAESPSLPPEAKKKLPGVMKLFHKHWDLMEREQQDRLADFLSYSPKLQTAWTIKEQFYYFYSAPDRATAERMYGEWVKYALEHQPAEWKKLMGTVHRWRNEIFNYFDERYTSGGVERMNRSIADINRLANGMDFETLRAKAILRYGRFIPPETFRVYFEQGMGDAVSEMLAPYLEPDAWLDDVDRDRAVRSSGIDPSTWVADLEAGRF